MDIHQLLRDHWGFDQFRPLQEDIIRSVLAGRDTLALMPTGGGKSLCFQVPALAQAGVCIVVSPLIALMKDQVEALKRRGIRAVAVYSGMSRSEIDITLDNCIYGDVKFLYVSPERLQTDLMRERTKRMNVCLLAVDEAHCVSAWGYDFRPPYLQIAEFRELIPKVPLIALTATATREVRADVQEKLGMRQPAVFQQSFARPNLSYSALPEENKEQRLLRMVQKVFGSGAGGAAVVYVRNRKRTQLIANQLSQQGIPATFYHAGLSNEERSTRQDAWLKNSVRVMVATNAFGMGIDKPDVRLVVHLDLPDTLEAYYQEAGRAGRDGQKAWAVALYGPADARDLERQIEQSYPPAEQVRRVYQCLANYYRLAVGSGAGAGFEFDSADFQATFGLQSTETFYGLKTLESEGFIQLSDAFFRPSKLHLTVDNRELYEFQVKNAQFDAFTKLLLRMYGGEVFSAFVPISETALAKNFRVPMPEIQQLLRQLVSMGIADYEPQKTKPTLTFLMPRLDAATLPLSLQTIALRRQRDLDKARAVATYVQQTRRCRTQMLLEYFDERSDTECGVCDNCLAKRRQRSDQATIQSGVGATFSERERILNTLAGSSMTVHKLIATLAPRNENALILVLREMVATGEVTYDAVGNLYKS
ncbi:MAG: RecQ family ATP-dependent DNA helicase [Cytophagaceae bacterium]|nr:RecQ family ATP-dependent DNA helicase [Cytophagaceae bacterium]